jgi:hypothetical protein
VARATTAFWIRVLSSCTFVPIVSSFAFTPSVELGEHLLDVVGVDVDEVLPLENRLQRRALPRGRTPADDDGLGALDGGRRGEVAVDNGVVQALPLWRERAVGPAEPIERLRVGLGNGVGSGGQALRGPLSPGGRALGRAGLGRVELLDTRDLNHIRMENSNLTLSRGSRTSVYNGVISTLQSLAANFLVELTSSLNSPAQLFMHFLVAATKKCLGNIILMPNN